MQLPAITLPFILLVSTASATLATPQQPQVQAQIVPIRWETLECGKHCPKNITDILHKLPPQWQRFHDGTLMRNFTGPLKPPKPAKGKIEWALLAEVLRNRTATLKKQNSTATAPPRFILG
ncbi:uncharacterized protein H6S33_011460 [Morchella sextelata]|uniref:uncharacterized protein n=1 Tax=Morchella sextelata TaxID=1174677 RepID=UPI001D046584|nr:uncharacterized protein H6S33_011460 [Morchella sextelata]KAH0611033.1 hypothetical protein H6S33_011460 [Morchella sextelata]